jgi:hypothetical protein
MGNFVPLFKQLFAAEILPVEMNERNDGTTGKMLRMTLSAGTSKNWFVPLFGTNLQRSISQTLSCVVMLDVDVSFKACHQE